jgi:hypothetical protein
MAAIGALEPPSRVRLNAYSWLKADPHAWPQTVVSSGKRRPDSPVEYLTIWSFRTGPWKQHWPSQAAELHTPVDRFLPLAQCGGVIYPCTDREGTLSVEQVERRFAAILVADVVAYSRLISEARKARLRALQPKRREIADPKIVEHRGRIFKTAGDQSVAVRLCGCGSS